LIDFCKGTIISKSKVNGATKPEPVVFDGAHFFVGFTNIQHVSTSPADPPVVDPGVVAEFTVDGDTMTPGPAATLPCKNPQGLALDANFLWASCSGPLGPDGGNHQHATEDGALVKLDVANNLAVVATINAARLAPGTPAVFGTTIVAGSIVTPDVL